MMTLQDGSTRLLAEDISALPWLGGGEDLMRVLHVDEQMGQVIFIQRFAQDTTHPLHTHHCTAVAYTLAGCWAYDGEPFPQGALAFEPFGSTHTPMTRNGCTADVLVVLTAGPGNGRLLEIHYPGGQTVEFDIAAFKALSLMRSNDEWPPFAARLAGGQ